MREVREPLLGAGSPWIQLGADQCLSRRPREFQDAAGNVRDAAASQVAVPDAVGGGDEDAVGVGSGDAVDVEHREVAPAAGFGDPIVGGVGRYAEDLCALQGEGAGGFGEPGVVADEEPDPPQRSVEDRKLSPRLVQELLFVPEVRLAVASEHTGS